ncbi:hypothetical protein AOQ84DRAFT_88094 [Glonium stellatum]|uniref:Uncharacterized protein n=1 Tax=Glonium stellatum TaxID=574774 RepID=A0A8E2EW36_9PEZI|nr:hypothetical protein AOQ84DRAFT_88094 [Glonium stellatum]
MRSKGSAYLVSGGLLRLLGNFSSSLCGFLLFVEQHYQGRTIQFSFTHAPNVRRYIHKGTEKDVGIMQ